MQDLAEVRPRAHREPWNRGKLIGAKPPLRSKHVWSIPDEAPGRGTNTRLGQFNLAIDSKLRGCDIVAIKVEDVAPSGYASIERRSGRRRPANRFALR